MVTSSARGSRLPLILVILLLVAVVAAGWWLMSRQRGADPAAPGGAAGAVFASLAFDPSTCGTAQDIPSPGWDYPQTAATVEGWVANRDVARTRVHGWWLWAALNHVSQGQPLWRNWCTSTQAFPYQYDPSAGVASGDGPLSLGARRAALTMKSDKSIDLDGPVYPAATGPCVAPRSNPATLRDGPSFANNTDIMVAGVIYNPAAYNSIVSQRLNVKQTLQNTPLQGPNRIGSVSLAPGSVVLKPMMWPVQASGYTALPVWSDKQTDPKQYVGFEQRSVWDRAVAVTVDKAGGPARVDVQLPLPGVTKPKSVGGGAWPPSVYQGAEVVPVDRFYAYRPDVGALDACDKAILDQSASAAYGRSFQQGDFLILIAMHIMTKEQPAWTFQSVYWSDRPNEGPNAADRPVMPSVKGPWRNYLMASTYGIQEPGTAGRPPVWGVHYNPYIEPAAGHPVATNCMNCHMRGAFAPTDAQGKQLGIAAYLTTDNTDDPGAIGVLTPDNPIFSDLVKTDFQWSLPNRAGTPPRTAARGGKAGAAGKAAPR
jgi:hypothetical protein